MRLFLSIWIKKYSGLLPLYDLNLFIIETKLEPVRLSKSLLSILEIVGSPLRPSFKKSFFASRIVILFLSFAIVIKCLKIS